MCLNALPVEVACFRVSGVLLSWGFLLCYCRVSAPFGARSDAILGGEDFCAGGDAGDEKNRARSRMRPKGIPNRGFLLEAASLTEASVMIDLWLGLPLGGCSW